MNVHDGVIEFEYLSAVSSSSVGNDMPITAKAPSFHAANAPGEARDVDGVEHIYRMGLESISNFKRNFSTSTL